MQRAKAASVVSFSQRFAVRAAILALSAALVSAGAVVGCSDDTPSYPPGAVPSVVSVDAVEVEPARDDAGEILGGCCSFTVGITYTLPEAEFIREGHIQWATLDSPTRFQYPASEALAGAAPGTEKVTLTAEIPPVLIANGATLAFTVVLVSGRGERSVPAGGTLAIVNRQQK